MDGSFVLVGVVVPVAFRGRDAREDVLLVDVFVVEDFGGVLLITHMPSR